MVHVGVWTQRPLPGACPAGEEGEVDARQAALWEERPSLRTDVVLLTKNQQVPARLGGPVCTAPVAQDAWFAL